MNSLHAGLAVALTAFALTSEAQTGTEIILLDLKIKKSGMEVSNPRNITNHPGYDNQPYFHSDRPVIYFSSFNDEGRSDIKSYDFKQKKTVNVTTTSEREYSPTLTPDKQYLSCIIQRDNGAQDLGKYPVEGGEPTVLISNLVVGYHVWSDNSHIAMFILGHGEAPSTLHYMRLPTKEDTVVATNIGRSLHKIPGTRNISYIQRQGEAGMIMRLDTEKMNVSTITNTLANSDHIAWTPDGKVLGSDGTKLFYFDPTNVSTGWQPVTVKGSADLLKAITRLSVNARGDKLAVVVGE